MYLTLPLKKRIDKYIKTKKLALFIDIHVLNMYYYIFFSLNLFICLLNYDFILFYTK